MVTKFLHETAANTAGRMNAVALCGRLVGRLSLTSGDAVTCPKCKAKQAPAMSGDDSRPANQPGDDVLVKIIRPDLAKNGARNYGNCAKCGEWVALEDRTVCLSCGGN